MGRKFFTVSFDDGTEQDIRVTELMRKYGIRGTFNLSSGLFGQQSGIIERTVRESLPGGGERQIKVRYAHNILPMEEAQRLYAAEFIETAGHGAHHLHQAGLGRKALKEEIADDALRLSEIFGKKVSGHIFPYGEYDEDCISVMREAGLCYGRLACSGSPDTDFRLKTDRGIIRPTCRITDHFAFPLLQRFISTEAEDDLVFFIWGHSYELDYGTQYACDWHLEEIFKTAACAECLEFVTNGELMQALEDKKNEAFI
ncbi:MAG: polysaccharide deacetylase family protein [Oscillospiraceae bacterium]|nr:polysaccharide deacetylase family protein [Oscillospiraceae bacterium]